MFHEKYWTFCWTNFPKKMLDLFCWRTFTHKMFEFLLENAFQENVEFGLDTFAQETVGNCAWRKFSQKMLTFCWRIFPQEISLGKKILRKCRNFRCRIFPNEMLDFFVENISPEISAFLLEWEWTFCWISCKKSIGVFLLEKKLTENVRLFVGDFLIEFLEILRNCHRKVSGNIKILNFCYGQYKTPKGIGFQHHCRK